MSGGNETTKLAQTPTVRIAHECRKTTFVSI